MNNRRGKPANDDPARFVKSEYDPVDTFEREPGGRLYEEPPAAPLPAPSKERKPVRKKKRRKTKPAEPPQPKPVESPQPAPTLAPKENTRYATDGPLVAEGVEGIKNSEYANAQKAAEALAPRAEGPATLSSKVDRLRHKIRRALMNPSH